MSSSMSSSSSSSTRDGDAAPDLLRDGQSDPELKTATSPPQNPPVSYSTQRCSSFASPSA
eukprot:549037-Heterocapsa_arctica.AAC.1